MSLRILVVEDTPKHYSDAQDYCKQLAGVVVDFATTLSQALELLEGNKYDAAICDVFFPEKVDAPADTFENALALSAKLNEMGVWHVFNTAGNHHGRQYQGFLWKTPRATHTENPVGKSAACYDFRATGCIIESYKSDSDTDNKQWEAAFRCVLLVHELLQLLDKGTEIIDACGEILDGFPYGDYGKLTERLRKITHPFVTEVFERYHA